MRVQTSSTCRRSREAPQENSAAGLPLPVEKASWLATLARYSDLAARVQASLTFIGDSGNGREPAKPKYTLSWPARLDEADPDLGHPSLPVNLPAILHDLDDMRATLQEVGAGTRRLIVRVAGARRHGRRPTARAIHLVDAEPDVLAVALPRYGASRRLPKSRFREVR